MSLAEVDITQRVKSVLAKVADPEIPAVSLMDLGIIRDVVRIPGGGHEVIMTPTYTGCPATRVVELSIRVALDQAGFKDVGVRSTLSPPWTTDWITDEGREKLRVYGIAPPARGNGRGKLKEEEAPQCPLCGSENTSEVSRFGSTPCKALWRCLDCREPFDRFKCI